MIIDCTRGLIIDTITAETEESAIDSMLQKYSLCKYQVNQLCITEVIHQH